MYNNNFLKDIIFPKKWTKTLNGMPARVSTDDTFLDAFSKIGALRGRTQDDIMAIFLNAYGYDNLLALKLLFYARNIRGGLGERDTFRIILHHMANVEPSVIKANLHNIAKFGRWDDYFALLNTPVEVDMWAFLGAQLLSDYASVKDGKPISLLAKWLPSINSHSSTTHRFAETVASAFGMTEEKYRKDVAFLRKHLNLVETKMSRRDWDKIDYEVVPSRAMTLYRKSFSRHDANRFVDYLNKVKSGDAKIKANTVFPYDLTLKYLNHIINPVAYTPDGVGCDETIEAQWKALPNFITHDSDYLVVADTSGSMTTRFNNPLGNIPIATSIGLALYFAEHNKGAFKNKVINFSKTPEVTVVNPDLTLLERIRAVMSKPFGTSTNIIAVFNLVLELAKNNGLKDKDLPKAIVVISDMEFDRAVNGDSRQVTFYETMEKLYKDAGFTLPKLIFWNVNARSNLSHATYNDNVQFISGHSQSQFKTLVTGTTLSALDLAKKALSDPMYDTVVLPEGGK